MGLDYKGYVLAFAFSEDMSQVVMIQKNRPAWQAGKYNGVGGKIESTDHSALHAMVREFQEETGVFTNEYDWHHFATMIFENDIMGGKAKIYCYKIQMENVKLCQTLEDEQIDILPTALVRRGGDKMMENVPILINLALSNFKYTVLTQ